MTVVIEAITALGRSGLEVYRFIGVCGRLFLGFVYWLLIAPFRGFKWKVGETARQAVRMGVNAIPIVFLVNFFVGVTLAVVVANILQQFGTVEYTAAVMGVGFWRELSPLLTGIIMAGFAGASLAAEIGTMKVGEELMALEAAALNPIRFLCVPRLLALLVMVPIVTLFGNVFGIFGGFVVCHSLMDLSPKLYWDKMLDAMDPGLEDIWVGALKSFVFGAIVGLVGLAQGLQVRGGAEGVGRATTNAVVYAIVLIIFADCIVTMWVTFWL